MNKTTSQNYFSSRRQFHKGLAETSGVTAVLETRSSSKMQGGFLGRSSTQQLRKRPIKPSRFSGEWNGSVSQTNYGFNPPRYSYTMSLRRRGTSFVGISTVRDFINPSIFGTMTLRGRVVNGSLLFKETAIYDQSLPATISRWCLKGGRLRISRYANGRTFLSGFWSDPGCNDGQILLEKQFL